MAVYAPPATSQIPNYTSREPFIVAIITHFIGLLQHLFTLLQCLILSFSHYPMPSIWPITFLNGTISRIDVVLSNPLCISTMKCHIIRLDNIGHYSRENTCTLNHVISYQIWQQVTAGTVLFVMLSLTWVRTYVNIGLIKPNSGASCQEKPQSGASQDTHLFGEIDGNPSRHCSRH